jgi:hypothetical protein
MFKWLRPRIEIKGEILYLPPPPMDVHIALVPPPVEKSQEPIEYGPLRLVGEEDA